MTEGITEGMTEEPQTNLWKLTVNYPDGANADEYAFVEEPNHTTSRGDLLENSNLHGLSSFWGTQARLVDGHVEPGGELDVIVSWAKVATVALEQAAIPQPRIRMK